MWNIIPRRRHICRGNIVIVTFTKYERYGSTLDEPKCAQNFFGFHNFPIYAWMTPSMEKLIAISFICVCVSCRWSTYLMQPNENKEPLWSSFQWGERIRWIVYAWRIQWFDEMWTPRLCSFINFEALGRNANTYYYIWVVIAFMKFVHNTLWEFSILG